MFGVRNGVCAYALQPGGVKTDMALLVPSGRGWEKGVSIIPLHCRPFYGVKLKFGKLANKGSLDRRCYACGRILCVVNKRKEAMVKWTIFGFPLGY